MIKTLLAIVGDRSYVIAASVLWNRLPLELRQAKSGAIFKGYLKSYLFEKAYSLIMSPFITFHGTSGFQLIKLDCEKAVQGQ